MGPWFDELVPPGTGTGHTGAMVSNGHVAENRSGIFGKRYGEVLLVKMSESGPEAEVYNTFGLNDCPAQLWDRLDPEALARENGAAAVLLNGPRYWLMSDIERRSDEPQETRSFGGIDMIRQAAVKLSSTNPSPYTVNRVDRRTVFTFAAGRPVFELVDPEGQRWVMQTWSQVVDRHLTLDDLPGLGARLQLPAGWRYTTRTLTSPMTVDTTTRDAHVIQDELTNSYSLQL